MGPIKNPCCGEAKRRERAGGGKKKGKRGESTLETDGKTKGAVERGRRTRKKEGASRARRVTRPFSLFFKTRDTLLSVVDQRSTCPASRINSRASNVRITFQREKQESPVPSSQITRSTNFCGLLEEEPRSLGLFFYRQVTRRP